MASEFFNPDNKVMSILSRIGDIMLISICFTIASLRSLLWVHRLPPDTVI